MLIEEVLKQWNDEKKGELVLKGSRLMTEIVGLMKDKEELVKKIEVKQKELCNLKVEELNPELLSVLKDYISKNQ